MAGPAPPHTVTFDVTDPDAVQRAADATAAALGKIDILVASAGITGPNTSTWEYPVEAWDRVIDVNLKGVFYCNRAVVPFMQRATAMAGSSTSPRSPARRATRTPRPTPPPRPASSA